jgi:hypothetical protein
MRILALSIVLLFVNARLSLAQWTIYDPANTARNTVTAVLKQRLVEAQTMQRVQLERMARRLAGLTDLQKYYVRDTPEWRIHDFWDESISPLARDYHAALNYGDRSGRALLAVSHELRSSGLPGELTATALRAIRSRLATIDATGAALMTATHGAGLTRYNGRRELAAIEALEQDVIDPTDQQSATAVLEKLSGASLVGIRQRQARIALLGALVEHLLLDSKRARDTDAAAMNMQLVNWRDGRAANEAFVAGSGDALRTWRQP